MVKVKIERFIEQAKKANKYDPQWTVAKVRAGRKWLSLDSSWHQQISLESEETHDVVQEQDKEEIGWEKTDYERAEPSSSAHTTLPEDKKGTLIIPIPSSLDQIKLLSNIITSHAGDDFTISVHGKEYAISSQGMDIIRQFI